jgi:cytochrome P450
MKNLNPAFETIEYQNTLNTFFSHIHDTSPIFCNNDGNIYLATYNDCQQLLQNTLFTRCPINSSSPFSLEPNYNELSLCEKMIENWMVFQDPPKHTHARAALNKIFTPKYIEQLRSKITTIASSLLSQLPGRGDFDFMDSVAYPYPILVIASFFNIPDIDLERFKTWSYQLSVGLNTGNPNDLHNADEAVIALKKYFDDLFIQRKNNIGDDVLSLLINLLNNNEIDYDTVIDTCIFLIWAGHETTKLLISNGLFLLLSNKSQYDYFLYNEYSTNQAIEEILRFESPIQKISRWSSCECEIQGIKIPPNTLITALLGAANRDPLVFASPNKFDITRSNNKHLAFGKGIHHCLGASLARMEAQIMFDLLRPKLHQLHLADYKWRPTSAFRCLDTLILKKKPV